MAASPFLHHRGGGLPKPAFGLPITARKNCQNPPAFSFAAK
jgi:hypothetical protein